MTEGLMALVREYAPQLPPADIVRLLTILGESEERLSRSANQRLLVEILLLRWAMVDRTVELSEVIDALKAGGSPTSQDSPPARVTASPPGQKLEPTLDNVRSAWSAIVAEARAKTPLLGSLLAEAEVVAVDGRMVTLRPGHAVHAEGLERQRETIAQSIGRYVSEAPRVRIAETRGPVAPGPERMTEDRANAERLKSLRAKDPTLSAAVDALDLELLE
jgi:DNA polymerase-3 subunit gamma/tau